MKRADSNLLNGLSKRITIKACREDDEQKENNILGGIFE